MISNIILTTMSLYDKIISGYDYGIIEQSCIVCSRRIYVRRDIWMTIENNKNHKCGCCSWECKYILQILL